MNTIKGDLIALAKEGRFDVIIHGCNCFCAMGAGIAKTIRDLYPSAFQADLDTEMGDKDKLGTYSSAVINNNGQPFTIINGYTQYEYSGREILADYAAIRTLFKRIRSDFPGKRIGYPKIGAGLAGGDWQIIAGIIEEELFDMDHTLVEYQP